MAKIDLHTHSIASYDGGLKAAHYERALQTSVLDCIAITDHNRIDFALEMHKRHGDQIIVGEEIMSTQGEIIGLYLTKAVPPGLSAADTINQIQKQGGLVYIPHPFETVRKGMTLEALDSVAKQVDIIEIYNGRAFAQNRSHRALTWAQEHHCLSAASSDAHGYGGLGRTYTWVESIPTSNSLKKLLQTARYNTSRPAFRALLHPKYHRLRKRMGGA